MSSVVWRRAAAEGVVVRATGRACFFLATEAHTLWANDPASHFRGVPLVVPLHAYEGEVTLVLLLGSVFVVEEDDAGYLCPLTAARHHAGARPGAPNFQPVPSTPPRPFGLTAFALPVARRLPMDTLHTLYVPRGQRAAWGLLEGPRPLGVRPIVWSNDERLLYEPLPPRPDAAADGPVWAALATELAPLRTLLDVLVPGAPR